MSTNDDVIIIGGDHESLEYVDPEPIIQRTGELTVVYVPSLTHPIAYRNEDFPIVKSILDENEYKLNFTSDFEPKVIFDLGGHIGTAAAYFTNTYPNAKVYSVEPEKNNFKMLTYNTIFYDNVIRFNCAIWNKREKVKIVDNGYGLAGYMIEPAEIGDTTVDIVDTITIPQLMDLANCDTIDILKIDIEGSEKELFDLQTVHDWLGKVRILFIELHDRIKRGCSSAFFKAISQYNWYFAMSKENLVIIRET